MSTASPAVWIAVAIVVLAALAAIAAAVARSNRTKALRARFGTEYDRALAEYPDRPSAEAALMKRQGRRERMHIEELRSEARVQYAQEWRTVQSRFVEEPRAALLEADHLIGRVMKDRGYPNNSYEQRLEDLSTDYGNVLTNYRSAHDVAERAENGRASTEEQRQAMIHFRSLFEQLVGSGR